MPRYDDLPFAPLPGREVTVDGFFQALVYEVLTRLRVCIPATVQSWDAPVSGAQPRPATVTIKLDFKRVRAIDNASEVRDGETLLTESAGLRAVGEFPAFERVPVLSFGSPAFNIRGPIAAGTTGLYLIADRCIDQWLNTGGPLDPATADKHDINDGFFLPTAYHGKNSPTISSEVHQLGRDDGSAGLEIAVADKSIRVFTDGPTATVDAETLIKLGEAATEAIAKAETLISVIDAAWNAATPVANDGGANLKTTWLASWNAAKNSIKATKGRTE